jgi:hypothetical protein
MHGLIFAGLRGYVEGKRDPETAWEALGERAYVIHESHPDEVFLEALERTGRLLGMEPDELLRDFGVFTGRRFFPRLFPMMYSPHISSRSFLPVVDEQIHSIVRKAAPGSITPGLAVHVDDGDVVIAYSSVRKLCVFLSGLLEGTALYFGERATLAEQTCMRNGDPVCLIRMQLTPR